MSTDFFGPAQRPQWLLVGVLALAAGIIFATDLTVAHGYTVWVLYLPLCVAVAWYNRPREAIGATVTATVLIATAGIIGAEQGFAWPAIVSRTLEALTIWLAVLLVLFRQSAARSTEAALTAAREANDRLGGIIINTADDGIISIDADQRITLFNHGAERIFGYSAAEMIGQKLTVLLPARASTAHGGLVHQFGQSHVQSRSMAERGVVTCVRKDGGAFPSEISISKLSAPQGTVYTAILRDISERVKADALFREREQRLRVALSAGHMGVFQVDQVANTVRQDEAAAALLGMDSSRTESTVDAFFEQVRPDDRPAVRDEIERLRREGGDFAMEFRVPIPGDGDRWIAADGFCELDSQGNAIRAMGVVHDITARKGTERALEARVAERTAALREEIARREETQTALIRSQKLQAVGELAGGMAHDFNNLLTVITGNLELLSFRQLDDKARDHVRRAEEAAKMGARLAGRLLGIGRRQRLQSVALDLNEIARSMSDVLRRTLGDEIVLETSFADDLWPAVADVSEVENAVLNLAVNARDAMPHGGKLIVKTENKSLGPDDVVGEAGLKPGAYALLSVTDTGTGMPPDVLARAFEPYFTTKEMGRGTGLGLSTIYGFAKQLGGHVTIYSEVGKGTSVRLYLPRSTSASDAERDTGAAPALPTAEGERILVVEDNADVRDATVKRLDMLGYRVFVAEHAPRAMEILKSEPNIARVFSDVMMPGGMSGFDLAAWIRANRPEVKVLLTSGFTGEVARNGEAAVADIEVLRKPYATADLARAVRETLAS